MQSMSKIHKGPCNYKTAKQNKNNPVQNKCLYFLFTSSKYAEVSVHEQEQQLCPQ